MSMLPLFCFVVIVVMLLWFSHKRLCVEISSKNKIEFYNKARELLKEGSLNHLQKEKVFKWADTLENKRYAWLFLMSVSDVCADIKKGKQPNIDEKQRINYTEDMARLFVYWMGAQMYSVPLMSWYASARIAYIFSDEQKKVSAQIEVNRDVFKNDMLAVAV